MTNQDRRALMVMMAFFLGLAVISCSVHVCTEDAQGQTPPMNPVSYDWGVDPLGVYLNTLDTYRVLQQHEAEIDSNIAEIDTLQLEVDTLRLWADTLKLEVDTLRLRVDSIQISRDTVFYAYATDLDSVAALSQERIWLHTEIKEDAIYVHAANEAAVACNSAGWYNVDYTVSVESEDDATAISVYSVLQKYSGSWANINGSHAFGKTAGTANDWVHLSGSIIVELTSGDSLAVSVYNLSASQLLVTELLGASLRIEKLH